MSDCDRCVGDEQIRVITIESDMLRVEMMPELGAKIYSVFYKPLGREVLWHNTAVQPHRVSAVDSYDDHWSGGWDDLFPNDEAAFPETWNFPDHGELWSAAWKANIRESDGAITVHFEVDCPLSKVRVEKTVAIAAVETSVTVHYTFTNLNSAAVPFLFKLHPALAVQPGDRLRIPAKKFVLEPRFLGTLSEGAVVNDGPVLKQPQRTVDLQVVPPPEAKELFFAYGTELMNGTAVLESSTRGIQVSVQYPTDFFKACWLFASYGGWNDYYVAVPEPCNGYPFRLEEALRDGSADWLRQGEKREVSVRMIINGL